MSGPSFVLGIDLAGYGRNSGYALLDADARLVEVGRSPLSDDEIVALATRAGSGIVGIDAPMALPEGMDCLDPGCPCAPVHQRGMRTAELALRLAGIGCYATTKRTIIAGLVRRGMSLRGRLEGTGQRPIEVYPFGAKVRLFGRPPRGVRKTTAAGRGWLGKRLPSIVDGLPAGELDDDRADAVLAAYTALLVARGEAEALGDPAEGAIWLPPPALRASVPGATLTTPNARRIQ